MPQTWIHDQDKIRLKFIAFAVQTNERKRGKSLAPTNSVCNKFSRFIRQIDNPYRLQKKETNVIQYHVNVKAQRPADQPSGRIFNKKRIIYF